MRRADDARADVIERSSARRTTAPRVKICGLTKLDDALLAIDLGAAFLGINFHPPSPRFMRPRQAADLVDTVRQLRPQSAARWVGVFVDSTRPDVERIAEVADLDLVQFHGDESAQEMAPLAARAIRVFRVRGGVDRRSLDEAMRPWREAGTWGYLLDTHHDELRGGTGESWDFASLGSSADDAGGDQTRLFVAGGLGPDNVGAVLDACAPWGIDLASGVETEPGIKDPVLLRRLFEQLPRASG